ncbi:hypothetical protein GGR52DRAFT_559914 [Hypoxylon sp. FL1284]|nr:hypothetical protein GGR52DRAFT_559914 [Hypoxylon sp. FL1284]
MSTPYICRPCIARLSRQTGHWKPSRLYDQAAPPSVSVSQSASISTEEGRWGSALQDYLPVSNETEAKARVSLGLQRQQQDELAVAPKARWDGHLRKFTLPPRRMKTQKNTPPIQTIQDLKETILASLGYQWAAYDELKRFYNLTHEEARHALTQLARLLWNRNSLEEAATLLDSYLEWKANFKQLREEMGSLTTANNSDEQLVNDAWHRLEPQRREALWPNTIWSILRSIPSMVPDFIRKTYQASWCPSYVVEDSVYLLCRDWDEDSRDGSHMRQQLTDLVFFLLRNSPKRYLSLEQTILRKVSSRLSTPQVLGLCEALKAADHPLHYNTVLHFASRLARHSAYKVQAAELCVSVRNHHGFDINSTAAASVCTTLLHLGPGDTIPDDAAAPDKLFKLLLDIGFRPNLLGLSTLMRNFCVRGRVEVAWDVFNSLIQRDIQPDVHVFSILLNGAKTTLEVEYLDRVVAVVNASNCWSHYLLHDLLDFVYRGNEAFNKSYDGTQKLSRYDRKANAKEAWRLMVQIYAKHFHLAPLQTLTLFPLENLLSPRAEERLAPHLQQMSRLAATVSAVPDDRLLQPDNITLSMMFKAHLRSIRDPRNLTAYYNHYTGLFDKQDQTVVELVRHKGAMIRDIFLRDFLQFNVTVKYAFQMVRIASEESRRHETLTLDPPPSVYTYSILMNGLRFHGRPRGVMATLVTMIKAGIKPNIVTWNVVIATLLQENKIATAVRVMHHMEKMSLRASNRTVREIAGLSYSKRARIAHLMDRFRSQKPFALEDERSLAEFLLRIWSQKQPAVSTRRARRTSRQHTEAEERSVEESRPATEDGFENK